jgi:hypothetical protein
MEFVHDTTVDGRRIRALTIVDLCTTWCGRYDQEQLDRTLGGLAPWRPQD